MKNNKWFLLSLKTRIVISIIFFVLSITHSHFSLLILGPFILITTFLLYQYGAISFQKGQIKILLSIFFMYCWLHVLKIDKGTAWLLRSLFSVFLFYEFVLIIIQGIKVFEWIYLFRTMKMISSCILGLSCARAIFSFEYEKSQNENKHARKYNWIIKPNIISMLSASITGFIVLSFSIASDLHDKYVNWKTPSYDNERNADSLKLHEIYDIPNFFEIYKNVFDNTPISNEWIKTIEEYLMPKTKVLEIGAGTGRFTKFILREGIELVSIESNRNLCDELELKNTGDHFSIIHGFFPFSLPSDKFDIIILHQNVFIELVNQFHLVDICNYLKEYLYKGGHIIFDYFGEISIKVNNKFSTILESAIENVGSVVYKYKIIKSEKDTILSTLNLNVDNDEMGEYFFYEGQLEINFHDIEIITKTFENVGFNLVSKNEIKDIYTFFPSKMFLFIFKSNA